MQQNDGATTASNEGGVVVQFPGNRTTPAPLPRLSRAYPTPGSGVRSSSMFQAALTLRFDREAA